MEFLEHILWCNRQQKKDSERALRDAGPRARLAAAYGGQWTCHCGASNCFMCGGDAGRRAFFHEHRMHYPPDVLSKTLSGAALYMHLRRVALQTLEDRGRLTKCDHDTCEHADCPGYREWVA